MATIKTTRIEIRNGSAGTFKVREIGSIGNINHTLISMQLRETFEQANELACTLAVMRKLTAVHDHTN